MTRSIAATVLVLAVVASCTGDAMPPGDNAPDVPEVIGTEYSVNDVCEHLATSLCAARESCCRSVDLAYDDLRCEARERASCEATLDFVEAGLADFDGSYVDACLEDFARILDRCVLTAADLVYELFDLAKICGLAFAGTKSAGESCAVDAECAHGEDSIGRCDDTALICVQSRVGYEGASCDLTGSFCAPGLYCAYDLTQMPYVGTCRVAAGVGSDCNPADVVSPCGPGRFCDPATSMCALAKPGDEPCAGDIECESLSCLQSGICAYRSPVVDAADCTG